MYCAISGSVPEEPVLSVKSGHVFEKRLVEKHVQDTGKCPITGEDLSLEDLVAVKSNKNVKPRSAPVTSIPGLLGVFHNEWDAVMLETHQVRQQLHTIRQELSHALYQHDAACRVIARLIRERDALQATVESLSTGGAQESKRGTEDVEMDTEEGPSKRAKTGMPESAVAVMKATNDTLSKGRKKRSVPASLASPTDIQAFTLTNKQPLHTTSRGAILALALHPSAPGVVATASADHSLKVFDTAAKEVLGSLEGHTKKVLDVVYLDPATLVSSSADHTARLWTCSPGGEDEAQAYSPGAVLSEHEGDVTALSAHPSGQFFVTGSSDKTWCFYDAAQARCLHQARDLESGLTALEFHPDGLLLAGGTDDATVHVWEMRDQKAVVKFESHTGPIEAMAFSQNGYTMATAAQDGVKLWDLRKLKCVKTLTPYAEGVSARCLDFDASGLYLAVGGTDVRVYGMKQEHAVVQSWTNVPKKGVNAVRMGADARWLAVGSADHNLRVISAEGETQG